MRPLARILVVSFAVIASLGAGSAARAEAPALEVPRVYQVTRATGDAAWVEFDVANDVGGSYTATADPDGQTCTAPPGTWRCEITGLTDGTTYTFTATQTVGGVTSDSSAPSAPIVARDDVTAPVLVSATFSPLRLPASGGTVTATLHITDDRSGVDPEGVSVAASAVGESSTVTAPADLVSGDSNDGVYAATLAIPAYSPGTLNEWDLSLDKMWDRTGNEVDGGIGIDTPVLQVGVPDPPTDVQASMTGSALHLSWTPPADDWGSPITGYAIRNPRGDLTYRTTDSTPSIDVPAMDGNGASWQYFVQTLTAAGKSGDSPLSPAAPVGAQPPSAPSNVVATRGSRSATIRWSLPNANGSPITGSAVTLEPGDEHCPDAGQPCTITGLEADTTYTVSVTSTNGVGEGPASTPVLVTPYGPPEAPSAVAVTAGPMAVRVSWKPPASDHGSPITSYRVLARWPGWLQAMASCSSTATSCVVKVAPGRPWVFTVQAWNAGGWSPATDPITVTPYGPPAGSCSAKSSIDFHGPTAHLTWACADDPFGTTTSYAVHLTSASWKTYDYTTTSPQLAVVGLDDATTYTVQIAPLNSFGGAPYTFAGSFRIPDLDLRPARMGEPSASGIRRDAATVGWRGASVSGGTPVSRYEVRVLRGSTVVETLTIAPSARSVRLVKLAARTRYSVFVRARNFAGASSWSPSRALLTTP